MWLISSGISSRRLRRRGQFDDGPADAVIKILAEMFFAQGGGQILVGGGDEPHIHFDGIIGTQAGDLPVLQDTQQLGLHRQGHVADFIQEERASVGILKAALTVAAGVGVSALDVAEELVLQRPFIHACAVERDEALAPTAGVLVQCAGDEFLAGAVLAEDQDADVGGCELGDELQQRAGMGQTGR